MVKVINAEDAIAGRLATRAAKLALEGETVIIVNSEKAVITGNPKTILKDYLAKIHRGNPFKGPYTPKRPDRILKRIIRGMIPYKKSHGTKAFKRIKTYLGVPTKYEGKARELEEVSMKRGNILKYITLGDLSRQFGGFK